MPMSLDLKGGSSSAESAATMRDALSAGGGGSRAPVFNTATGGSKLTAETGGTASDPKVWLLAAAGGFILWRLARHKG